MGSGLQAQIGYGEESTWGTAVTVTRFWPLVQESVDSPKIDQIESAGIIAGQKVLKSQQWALGRVSVGGNVGHEIYTPGLGVLLKHMFGSIATEAADDLYEHTATPGTLDGKGLTFQIGRPQVGGTVTPFTHAGGKITSWEAAFKEGEFATLGLEMVAKSVVTGTALATPSYPSGLVPLHYASTGATLDGSPFKATSVTVAGANGQKVDRRFIGTREIDEPKEEDLRAYTGTIAAEWDSQSQYDDFVAGDEVAFSVASTQGDHSLTIAGNIRYDGGAPKVGGRQVLTRDLPIKFVATTTDASAISAVLINGDATP